MAVAALTLDPVIGDQVYRTRSGTVDTAAVKKGMVLITGATGAGYVQPATAAADPVLGVAIDNAAVGERVTYIIAPCDVRVLLSESQTIAVGDYLQTGVSSISAVTYPGEVAEISKVAPGASYVQAEATGIMNFAAKKIGYALEAKTTTTDEVVVLKMRFTG